MRPVIYFNPIALPKTKHYVPLWNRHVVSPKFTPGDPQLRMFLPPFWMKMIYPGKDCPKCLAVFKVHPQMTQFDVRQYLEKIYKVPVASVRLKMLYHDLAPLDAAEDPKRAAGFTLPHSLPREPERYEKLAYVHLPPGHDFEFPDIFEHKSPSEEIDRLLSGNTQELQPAKEDVEAETTELANTSQPPPTENQQRQQPKTYQGPSALPKWFS
ncbi:hypothetical protein AAHC03_020769 [Spirometra sp. Aus1]